MKGRRRHLWLNNSERRIVIEALNRLRNRLIAEERYTDAVDDLLVNVIG